MPPTPDYLYCTREDIDDIMSVEAVDLHLDDNQDGTVSDPPTDPDESARATRACQYATARIDLYCRTHYEPECLAESYIVREWAAILAAAWIAVRRGNPGAESLMKLRKEVLDELKLVQAGTLQIGDIGASQSGLPFYDNVTKRESYRVRKLRVQRPISDPTPGGPKNVDWSSELSYEI